MQNRNNQLAIHAATVIAFLCAIPLRWFTLTNAPIIGSPGDTWPGSITITGINGSVGFFYRLPIWLLLVVSAFATLIAATNLAGFTSIPRSVPLVALIVAGAHYIAPYFVLSEQISPSVGPIVALIATAVVVISSVSASGNDK
jgi:hypothetical protein